MIFISLAKFRNKPTKQSVAESNKLFEQMAKEGVKILSVYWTLGRYDSITTIEAKDEKAALKALVRWGDRLSTETLLVVPREEAIKLVE